MLNPEAYAHSVAGRPRAEWEPLADHLRAVGSRAASFAAAFGWSEIAEMAGRLHDIGKCSQRFQAYLAADRDANARGGDHSTAGAREALRAYPPPLGRILAFIIAGHHAGLSDGPDLTVRLSPGYDIPDYAGWQAQTGTLPPPPQRPGLSPGLPDQPGFMGAFFIRMLFSCLVDADFLETERFLAESAGSVPERGGHASLEDLRDRLRARMAGLRALPSSPLNALRNEVLDHARSRAASPPGLFTLTVPTGGGKTLASLSFALEHAVRHGLRRVVYVAPYTSIIEQTAAVFRDVLGSEDDVLEHHSNVEWQEAGDDEGRDGIAKLRRAAENWDVPVVVTTAVQFFESLFANRSSRCRKLHNLAGAAIVLDEAQTLPLPLLRPCMAALAELTTNYRASVVLCTATQPALRRMDEFRNGFALDDRRELAPDPARLYAALRRVRVERLATPVGDDVIAGRFAEQPRMLCIVNSRAHAHALYSAIRQLPGAVYLTTLMCPRHRRAVLASLRARLRATEEPVRVVATSLIEAGVDISFAEVWRAMAGLDAIAQAAGRCNREHTLPELGRVVVFTPVDEPPRAMRPFIQAAEAALRQHPDDPLTREAIRAYFGALYWQKGEGALDSALVLGRPGILPALKETARGWDFPFASIAQAFRMIEETMVPVVVPYDAEAESVLDRIAAMERPRTADLRRLQQYMVPIPRAARDDWLSRGVLRPVHERLGADLLRFQDLAHYDADSGVNLGHADQRAAESNIIS